MGLNFSGARRVDTGSSNPPETPFMRAAQEWDNRIGSARVQARNWRLMAFSCLALSAIFAVGFVAEALTSHWHVFVVPVDQYGKPGTVQLAGDVYNPTSAQEASFIARWVGQLFSKPTDPVVLSENERQAFSSLTDDARNTVTAWISNNDPTTEPSTFARTVQVNSVLQKSPNTYQVDWTENTFDSGTPSGSQNYTGLFTVKIIPPTSEAAILENPLGIYISSISWTRGQ